MMENSRRLAFTAVVALALSACLEADAEMTVRDQDTVEFQATFSIGLLDPTSGYCDNYADQHLVAELNSDLKCQLSGAFSLDSLPTVLAYYAEATGSAFSLTQEGGLYRLDTAFNRMFITEADPGPARELMEMTVGEGYISFALSGVDVTDTSGVVTDGGLKATFTINLIDFTEPGNETITHFIEFRLQDQRPFWQRWFN